MKERPPKHQLHGFSDASRMGYTVVVYLRIVQSNGKIDFNLVASKTRVAPLKKQSIPTGSACSCTVDEFCSESVGFVKQNRLKFYLIDSHAALC